MNLWLIAGVVACLALYAFFSASESAYSSLNRIRMKNLAKEGNKRAQMALELSENYDKLLSSILIGNTIVNILATSLATAAFVGYFGDFGVTLSTLVMTVAVLVLAEITPKTFAKEFTSEIAMATAPALRLFILLFTPLNLLFRGWKNLLGRIFKNPVEEAISEEELLTIVDEAQEGGSLDEHEGDLIRSAIEFNDLEASEILTSRVKLVAVEKDASIAEIQEAFHTHGYSRLPMYEGSVDNIVGVLHEKDFYDLLYRKREDIASVLKAVLYVAPSTPISTLLRNLQKAKLHMAVVVDEFGGTMGIVTMEDIIEELVGEIWDEHDEIVSNFKALGDDRFAVEGSCELQDFFEYFKLKGDYEFYDAKTVGGWVINELLHIPEKGEQFVFENLQVTVSKTDDRRVLEIEVGPAPAPAAAPLVPADM